MPFCPSSVLPSAVCSPVQNAEILFILRLGRIYVLGGEGIISVIQQKDPDHYELVGRDLAGRLWASHPEMRVIYMSGYTSDTIMHHGVLHEGIDFIEKPFPNKP